MQWYVVSPLLWLFWAELTVGIPQEVWFEDETTAAILPEEAVIQIHFKTSRLEV